MAHQRRQPASTGAGKATLSMQASRNNSYSGASSGAAAAAAGSYYPMPPHSPLPSGGGTRSHGNVRTLLVTEAAMKRALSRPDVLLGGSHTGRRGAAGSSSAPRRQTGHRRLGRSLSHKPRSWMRRSASNNVVMQKRPGMAHLHSQTDISASGSGGGAKQSATRRAEPAAEVSSGTMCCSCCKVATS